MSLAPTAPYIAVAEAKVYGTGDTTVSRRTLFPGSVEAITITDTTSADYIKTVASVGANELRPYSLVNISVTGGHFTVNSVLTIDGNYHQVGDVVEFSFTPSDIPSPRTITIKDSAATPNTLATISSTSDAARSKSHRKFVLGAAGLWLEADTVGVASGSTGSAVQTPASVAEGDMLYYTSGGWARLAVGTGTQVLKGGTDPAWSSTTPANLQPSGAGATVSKFLVGTKTYDPASVTGPNTTSTTVTVTGAAVGDYALATFSNQTTAWTLTAYVNATDTVTVVLQLSTGTVDLASGTLNVLVVKAA